MPYTPIVATLGYVLSPDGRQVLMLHRNARADDHHLGKYNGLGGKIEPDEDVLAGMRREIAEEAGIECTALSLRGTISWAGFAKQGEAWLGIVFAVTAFTAAPVPRHPAATPEWPAIDPLHDRSTRRCTPHYRPLTSPDHPPPL